MSWSRKTLKKEARTNLKQNYWMIVLVCFIMAFLFAEYGSSTSLIESFSQTRADSGTVHSRQIAEKRQNTKVVNSAIGGIGYNKNNKMVVTATNGVLSKVFNSSSKARLAISVTDMVNKVIDHKGFKSLVFSILGLIISILFLLFFKFIVTIGERRFFLENKNYPKTNVLRILFLYKEKNLINPMIVMDSFLL